MSGPHDSAGATAVEIEVLRRGYEAFDRGDFETVLDSMHEDVVWVQAQGVPDAGVLHGREAVRGWFRTWTEIFGEVSITLEELVEVGAEVVAIARLRGRGKESGVGVDMRFAQVWLMRDGKVARVREFADPDKALKSAAAGA